MTTDRRKQVEKIFNEARTMPSNERTRFLDTACADDATLKEQVQTLITAYDRTSDQADHSEFNATTLLYTETDKDTLVRERIGPYKVIREIGHGGMGTVYLVSRDDDVFQKKVAIKIVKRGMDSASVLRRFHRERQILASLEHPNIARLLDGGTTDDGLPYFVMEYIEGKPLYEYCDTHQLDTAARLRLFRRICSAVQFAHQNLIVHRDIKPGNILVNEEGEPKLLDFGIAKLLNPEFNDADNALTVASERVMTPQYASPEQVRGEAITTASDVYSLGIVLYELLTGQRPYRFKSNLPHEIVRVVCEQEPSKPSEVETRRQNEETADSTSQRVPAPLGRAMSASHLKGDLDNIVLKALSKEPERRYASVDKFSDDIRRHLEGLPISARPHTLSYRAGKFILRNRLAVAAASLLFLTLLAGIVGTTWQAANARAQRERAERRFSDVRRLANSFLFEFHDGIAGLPGATPMRELVVKRAVEYLDGLAQEAAGDASLQRELATAYERVGEIQGDPYTASLGDTASALESYRKAQAIREGLLTTMGNDAGLRREFAMGYLKMGDVLWVTGNLPGAHEVFDKARTIFEPLVEADPGNVQLRYDLSTNYIAIGDTFLEGGDIDSALANHRKALAIREELAAAATESKYRAGAGVGYIKIGDDLIRTGNTKGALDNYYKGIAVMESLLKTEPNNPKYRQYLDNTFQRTGTALMQDDNPKLALEYFNKMVASSEKAVADDPTNAVARRNLMGTYLSIGSTLAVQEKFPESLTYFRRGIDLATAISAADPSNVQARRDTVAAYYETARMLRKSKNYPESAKHYGRSLDIAEAIYAADPRGVQSRKDLGDIYDGLGNLNAEMKDPTAAIGFYQKSLALREALAVEAPGNAEIHMGISDSLYNMGQAHTELAADKTLGPEKRLDHLKLAQSLFTRSQGILQRMRDDGTLAKVYESRIDDLATALKECQAAIEAVKKN